MITPDCHPGRSLAGPHSRYEVAAAESTPPATMLNRMRGEQPGIGVQDLLLQQLQQPARPDAELGVVQPVNPLVGG
jgi:hypothetical protein